TVPGDSPSAPSSSPLFTFSASRPPPATPLLPYTTLFRSDNSGTLTVGARNTTTTSNNSSSTFSEQSVNVTLSATVSATGSTVNAGTVTFQVKNGRSEERRVGKGGRAPGGAAPAT